MMFGLSNFTESAIFIAKKPIPLAKRSQTLHNFLLFYCILSRGELIHLHLNHNRSNYDDELSMDDNLNYHHRSSVIELKNLFLKTSTDENRLIDLVCFVHLMTPFNQNDDLKTDIPKPLFSYYY